MIKKHKNNGNENDGNVTVVEKEDMEKDGNENNGNVTVIEKTEKKLAVKLRVTPH